jgi:hypothetical protein
MISRCTVQRKKNINFVLSHKVDFQWLLTQNLQAKSLTTMHTDTTMTPTICYGPRYKSLPSHLT